MCVHHEDIDSNCEPPCHCDGDEMGHWHSKCRLCGATRTYPAVSVYDATYRDIRDPALFTLLRGKREVYV